MVIDPFINQVAGNLYNADGSYLANLAKADGTPVLAPGVGFGRSDRTVRFTLRARRLGSSFFHPWGFTGAARLETASPLFRLESQYPTAWFT